MGSASMAEGAVHYHKPSASSTQGYPQHQHHPPSASSSPSVHAPPRVLTLDLKAKLASALGGQGKRYWDALLRFCTAKISRVEFESEARACLKSEDVHLHNSLVLGILYNASSAVPGPSASRKGWGTSGAFSASHSDHQTSIRQAEADAYQQENGDFEAEDVDPEAATASIEPEKRVNILAASFTTAERQRIKSMSKPLSRNLSSIANTSSWAGAGADLLERKRKEEEKKTKETERKRLKEQHTEIGGRDWLKEVIAEDLACQENRASLPAATAQALLRSSKVPLCVESKTLPQADSLADLMTAPAVEAGLSNGVSMDAADMLSAGLQAHVRNVVSGMILAVRANRAAGGVQLRGPTKQHLDSADSSVASLLSANSAAFSESPNSTSRGELPDFTSFDQAYSKIMTSVPTRPSQQSSRNSTSSSSLSTAASSIFTNAGGPRHIGVGPDASVTSLVSTAATTQVGSGSDAGSDVEMDSEKEGKIRAQRNNDSSDNSMAADDFDDDIKDDGTAPASLKRAARGADDSGIVLQHSYSPAALPHRPVYRTSAAHSESPRPSLSLRDLAFFLRLEPHVLVEPAGIGAMERLLAPDADEQGAALHQLEWSAGSNLGEEERLAVAARHSACSKETTEEDAHGEEGDASSIHRRPIAALPSLQASRDASVPSSPVSGRKGYLVKQQAPLSLLLHRDIVSSKRKQQTAGLEDAQSTNKRNHHTDPLSEVVDPVRLLAGYCS